MSTRAGALRRGTDRGRSIVQDLAHQAEAARIERGISFAQLGRALGISDVHAARICRGETSGVSIIRAAQMLAVLGLDLSARAYPVGSPVRDAGQLRLLGRLRTCLPASMGWRTEVPIRNVAPPGTIDLRAWDAVISGPDWWLPVEAETRSNDVQALQRRISLKQRDAGVHAILLLLADTRHHRDLVRLASDGLSAQFPIGARSALAALRAGRPPGGNAIVLL